MKISIIQNKIARKLIKSILIVSLWFFIWQLIYWLVGNEIFVPSPLTVLRRLFVLAVKAEFWYTVFFSIGRIFLGFIVGILLGILLGVVCNNQIMADILSPLKAIIKATPVASFIMLAWIWLRRDQIPVFIAMLMVTPILWGNISTGIQNVNQEYLAFAKVYDLTWAKKIKYIYVPTVLPYFTSAAYTAAGLVWKAGIAAEVLCQPKNSIGANLYQAKNLLDTQDVFAWTAVVIVISLCLESGMKLFFGKLGKKFTLAGVK